MSFPVRTVQLPNESWINVWQLCDLLAKSELATTPLGRHIAQWSYEEPPRPGDRSKPGKPKLLRTSMAEKKVRAANRTMSLDQVDRCWEAIGTYIATELPAHRRAWWPVELTSPAWQQIWSRYKSVQGDVAGQHRAAVESLLSRGKLQARDDDSDLGADKHLSLRTSISMVSALKYVALRDATNVVLINVPAQTLMLSRGHIAVRARLIPEDLQPPEIPERIRLYLADPHNHTWHRYRMPPRDQPDLKWLQLALGPAAASAAPAPHPQDLAQHRVKPYHSPRSFIQTWTDRHEVVPDQDQLPIELNAPKIPAARPHVSTTKAPREKRVVGIYKAAKELAATYQVPISDAIQVWNLVYTAAQNRRPPFTGVDDEFTVCWTDSNLAPQKSERDVFIAYWKRHVIQAARK